jgi:hypothetical protein
LHPHPPMSASGVNDRWMAPTQISARPRRPDRNTILRFAPTYPEGA